MKPLVNDPMLPVSATLPPDIISAIGDYRRLHGLSSVGEVIRLALNHFNFNSLSEPVDKQRPRGVTFRMPSRQRATLWARAMEHELTVTEIIRRAILALPDNPEPQRKDTQMATAPKKKPTPAPTKAPAKKSPAAKPVVKPAPKKAPAKPAPEKAPAKKSPPTKPAAKPAQKKAPAKKPAPKKK